MHQRFVTKKKVRPLKELVEDRLFIISKDKANSIDPVTGKSCIWVSVNSKTYNILVEEPTAIPYNVFCLLKDIGILDHYETFQEGEEF